MCRADHTNQGDKTTHERIAKEGREGGGVRSGEWSFLGEKEREVKEGGRENKTCTQKNKKEQGVRERTRDGERKNEADGEKEGLEVGEKGKGVVRKPGSGLSGIGWELVVTHQGPCLASASKAEFLSDF